jgi:hypothetical protein
MSEKLDECYELIVKLSKEGGQVGVPIFKYMKFFNKQWFLIFKNCQTYTVLKFNGWWNRRTQSNSKCLSVCCQGGIYLFLVTKRSDVL